MNKWTIEHNVCVCVCVNQKKQPPFCLVHLKLDGISQLLFGVEGRRGV